MNFFKVSVRFNYNLIKVNKLFNTFLFESGICRRMCSFFALITDLHQNCNSRISCLQSNAEKFDSTNQFMQIYDSTYFHMLQTVPFKRDEKKLLVSIEFLIFIIFTDSINIISRVFFLWFFIMIMIYFIFCAQRPTI